ncbi:RICIN domain-containing protein [Cohnella abietis]|uniref:Uncharacterized protein n=1 Tax=Cohnella abietis TaxID=2507935 RepID=A0A3T1DBM0_9BACL|nr:RICIN domain-containing protein [Cohnella abietis]BBI35492.1 hypothetical protein KCTCHS21_48910 [Cohnella abietis]
MKKKQSLKKLLTLIFSMVIILSAVLLPVGSKNIASANNAINVNIDMGNVIKDIDPMAYGLNATGLFIPSFTANEDYLENVKYLGGNGLIRMHSWSMVDNGLSVASWVNSDMSWNAAKIATTLAPVSGRYNIMINIPLGPDGALGSSNFEAWKTNFANWAAELVEIVNINNHFGVKYWEVPNEQEITFNNTGLNSSQMAQLLTAASRAMKAIDPTIKFGGPATADIEQNYNLLLDTVRNSYNDIDFLSFHTYSGSGIDPSRMQTDSGAYDHAMRQGQATKQFREDLDALNLGKYIPIYLDEYNISWDHDERMHGNKENVYDALIVAGLIGGSADIVNFWHAEGSYMGLMNDQNQLYSNSSMHYLFNRYFEGQVVSAQSADDTKIVAYATKDTNRKSLLIINRTASEQTVKPNLTGWAPDNLDMYQFAGSGSTGPTFINWASVSAAGITVPDNSVTILTAGSSPNMISGIKYKLTAKISGKALSIDGASTADGANVSQDAFNSAAAQKWFIEDAGDDSYKIINANSGKYLSVDASGQNVVQQVYSAGLFSR